MSNPCEPSPTVTKDDLKSLARRLAAKFDEVLEVFLVGSRSRGEEREDSDCDVAIRLRPECYDDEGRQINQIEQRVSFHHCCADDFDFFFIGPRKGQIRHWQYGPNETFDDYCERIGILEELHNFGDDDGMNPLTARILNSSIEDELDCLQFGKYCNSRKFFEDWKSRRLLFRRAGRKTE